MFRLPLFSPSFYSTLSSTATDYFNYSRLLLSLLPTLTLPGPFNKPFPRAQPIPVCSYPSRSLSLPLPEPSPSPRVFCHSLPSARFFDFLTLAFFPFSPVTALFLWSGFGSFFYWFFSPIPPYLSRHFLFPRLSFSLQLLIDSPATFVPDLPPHYSPIFHRFLFRAALIF